MDTLANQFSNQVAEQYARLTNSRRGFVLSIDQGTTSTRCIIFDGRGDKAADGVIRIGYTSRI